jgi:hypothetical protein
MDLRRPRRTVDDRRVRIRVASSALLRKLSGRHESRLRVGDWRVLVELDVEARRFVALRVLPRGRAYERLRPGLPSEPSRISIPRCVNPGIESRRSRSIDCSQTAGHGLR